MVLGPVSFGILIRKIIPGLPDWWDRLATVLASLSIVMIIMVVVATNQEQLAGVGFRIVTGLVGFLCFGIRIGKGIRVASKATANPVN